ncbi:MAG: hypothetical protein ALAOOOJD_03166 [bacterium]|nr:hypothetical protein [bacterium]
MAFEADTVAEPMHKVFAVAGVGDDLARGGIDRLARGARFRGGNAGALRLMYEPPNFFMARRGLAKYRGARHITGIALQARAAIHQHNVILLQRAWTRAAVRNGGGLRKLNQSAAG